MNDTEILDWLEENSNNFILVPPLHKEDYWGMYENGSMLVSSGKTLRDCVRKYLKAEIGICSCSMPTAVHVTQFNGTCAECGNEVRVYQ